MNRLLLMGLLLAGLSLAVGPVGAAGAATGWSRPTLLGARSDDGPRGAIGRDGTSVVTWIADRVVRVRVGDRRGRYEPVKRLSRTGFEISVAAVAPDGRAIVAWQDRFGLRVAVRPPRGRFGRSRVVTREVGHFPGLAVAADRAGGFVFAYVKDLGGGHSQIYATTLDRRGRHGMIDVLGPGDFMTTFEQEQALAVDRAGVAVLGFVSEEGRPVVARRPPGGRFSAPAPLGGASARGSLRLTSGPTGQLAASWLEFTAPGPLRARPAVALASPQGIFHIPIGAHNLPELSLPPEGSSYPPSAAPLGGDRAVMAWQRPGGVGGAPWIAPITPEGFGAAREVARRPGISAMVVPLARERALLVWTREGGALAASLWARDGQLARIAAPNGREWITDDAALGSRVVSTAGRYALIAWNDRDGRLRASVRRF